MLPFDHASARQLGEADMLVAHQRRTRGSVVRHGQPWTARLGSAITLHLADAPWTASHELFRGLSRKQLRRAADKFTVLDAEPGRSLGTQGAVAGEFVAILEGRVGVTVHGVPHAVLDDGSHFGAIPLLDDGESPELRASFDVMVPSRLAVADAFKFRTLLAEFPTIAQRVHAMADVRRAYLAGLAAGTEDARMRAGVDLTYPVHMLDSPTQA